MDFPLKFMRHSHITVTTWDCVLMSLSSELMALQDTILFRSLGWTRTLMFELVTHPPVALVAVCVLCISVVIVRLSTNHWIVAGGFELAVSQWKCKVSPTLASDGPLRITLAGATENDQISLHVSCYFLGIDVQINSICRQTHCFGCGLSHLICAALYLSERN